MKVEIEVCIYSPAGHHPLDLSNIIEQAVVIEIHFGLLLLLLLMYLRNQSLSNRPMFSFPYTYVMTFRLMEGHVWCLMCCILHRFWPCSTCYNCRFCSSLPMNDLLFPWSRPLLCFEYLHHPLLMAAWSQFPSKMRDVLEATARFLSPWKYFKIVFEKWLRKNSRRAQKKRQDLGMT